MLLRSSREEDNEGPIVVAAKPPRRRPSTDVGGARALAGGPVPVRRRVGGGGGCRGAVDAGVDRRERGDRDGVLEDASDLPDRDCSLDLFSFFCVMEYMR